ncbi:MAG: restriction endonuclease subunit S [Candidatus Thiodiazotropha sp.]
MTETTPTLSCVTEFIVDCLHKTAPTQETGFPLIRTPNIGRGRFNFDGVYRISQETYDKWTIRAVPQKNDLIMAREAPAGNVAIIKSEEPHCLGQRTVHIRPNPELIDPDFLTYFLLAPRQQASLLKNQIGVHVGHVNMKDIRKLPLEDLPPMEEQKKRAQIIADYDDLIENNKRRIELLEESARQLYKEWFVRFRFPGHEHVKIIDGIPEGWSKGCVSDLGEVITGKTPSTKIKENFGGDIPFVKTPDMHASSIIFEPEEYLSERGANTQAKKYLPKFSVLVACIGARLGVVSLNAHRCQTNQQINAVVPRSEKHIFYAYLTLKGFREKLLAIGGGATMPNVNKSKFSGMEVLLPPGSLLESFHDVVAQPFFQMEKLIEMNSKLTQARDLLLPKLMNGEIAV